MEFVWGSFPLVFKDDPSDFSGSTRRKVRRSAGPRTTVELIRVS